MSEVLFEPSARWGNHRASRGEMGVTAVGVGVCPAGRSLRPSLVPAS